MLFSEDDSPYPEVRSAVANSDDPEMPVDTLRAWVLGLIFAMIIPGINQLLYFRYPAVTISGVRFTLCPFPYVTRTSRTYIDTLPPPPTLPHSS